MGVALDVPKSSIDVYWRLIGWTILSGHEIESALCGILFFCSFHPQPFQYLKGIDHLYYAKSMMWFYPYKIIKVTTVIIGIFKCTLKWFFSDDCIYLLVWFTWLFSFFLFPFFFLILIGNG